MTETDPYLEHGKPKGAYAEALAKSAARREARLIERSRSDHRVADVGTPAEREERDKQRQWSMYEKSITLRRKQLFEGPEGEHFELLNIFLKNMTINDAPELIEAVKNSIWLSDTSQRTKEDALWLIDSTIIGLRIKNGLAPFDDPLMGEEPNAFLHIRKTLTGVGND